MKAGQQLVFGEQIGWLDPSGDPEPADRRLFPPGGRGALAVAPRYFYAGEMARPPKLLGPFPTVHARLAVGQPRLGHHRCGDDGPRTLPREHRCTLLFTNVSDQAVTARLQLDAAAYGIAGAKVRISTVNTPPKGDSPIFAGTKIGTVPRKAPLLQAGEGPSRRRDLKGG